MQILKVNDAHNSIVKNKNFANLKDRFEGNELDYVAQHEEIIDLRTSDDGITHLTSGDAVRTQISSIKNRLNSYSENTGKNTGRWNILY